MRKLDGDRTYRIQQVSVNGDDGHKYRRIERDI